MGFSAAHAYPGQGAHALLAAGADGDHPLTRRIFIVAGEPSGDRHAARLVTHLRELDPELQIDAYGMEALAAAGARVVFDMRDLAVMWFAAVIARLPTFVNLIRRTIASWRDNPPDAVVLVDYPGLNLIFAREARRLGILVIYYIPPQLWAWAPWRRRRLARVTDRVLTVLPFEAEFLADAGTHATYVGHPLADEEWLDPEPEDDLVLLMPGSRSAELDAHLELFLDAARAIKVHAPSARFLLAVAREKYRERIEAALARTELTIEIVDPESGRAAMSRARVAIAKSGTGTLELGLAGVPTVVVYRVGWFERIIGRMHMTSPFIGLINVVAGKQVAPELLLAHDDAAAIAAHAFELMQEGERRHATLAELAEVRATFAVPGAARRAAEATFAAMREREQGL